MSPPQHNRRGFDRQWLNVADVSAAADARADAAGHLASEQAGTAAAAAHEESRIASAAETAAQVECQRASAAVVEAQRTVAVAAERVAELVMAARDAAAAATLAAATAAQKAAASARVIAHAEADARVEADARAQRARNGDRPQARMGRPARPLTPLETAGAKDPRTSATAPLQRRSHSLGTALAEIAGGTVTSSSAERLSAAAAARSIGDVVQSARAAAALASRSATLAAAAEAAAATLAIASSAVASARAVAAAVDATAAVIEQAACAAETARRTEAVLTHEVLHDELTGLANRRLLVDRLTQALARSGRAGTSVGVFFIDVDGLKEVNDTLGHAEGDALLIGVARRLQRCLRDTDTCARVGGDEFVVVCEDLSHPSDGPLVAGRLESAIAAGVVVGEVLTPVYVSVGVAVGTTSAVPLDLLREADAAMYRVKQGRRSGDPAADVDAVRREATD